MRIQKISGQFSAVNDVVQLTKPANANQVALRLYEETLEIAIFIIDDVEAQSAHVNDQTAAAKTRSFMAWPAGADLPLSFLKYIGALGIPDKSVPEGFREVSIIEVL